MHCDESIVWSQQSPLLVEQFWSRPGIQPAVLFLHGANGLNHRYYDFALSVARCGYRTFLPHYFEPTGTTFADPSVSRARFPIWLDNLSRVLAFISRHPQVIQSSIGVVGVSLGATLALALPYCFSGIGAIAELFGEAPELLAWRIRDMPPTLFVHGDADCHIPLARLLQSVRRLENRGAQCEMRIYRGERHLFGRGSISDAVRDVHGFLYEYL